jgi:NADH:ubiquinone oxidoreductase subunit 4 (subunit M)
MIQIMLWLPVGIGLLCFVVPRKAVPALASIGSLVVLGRAIVAVAEFHAGQPGLQQTVDQSWIPDLGVRYQLGVDGISIFLVLLTALLWAGATVFSAFRVPDRRRIYFFMLGLAETATLGAFLAQDLLLFVLFFDLMLVPFWFLIGAFGGENRIAATTKMIVYTLVGSLLMLVAAIATAILASDQVGHLSFSIADLRAHTLSTGSQEWIFLFFAAAFLIKMPAVVVHGWLADAYRAAPLPVLALLAGVLSKVGAYGFLRVALPLYPQWGTEPNGFYIPPRHSPRGYARQMFGPGVDNAIEKYLVPSRELLAVLQLWRASQQIVFRYDVIPGPKVFETQIHGKRFEMYNDTVLGFNKSGKEVARIQVEEPIYIRPAERVTWL